VVVDGDKDARPAFYAVSVLRTTPCLEDGQGRAVAAGAGSKCAVMLSQVVCCLDVQRVLPTHGPQGEAVSAVRLPWLGKAILWGEVVRHVHLTPGLFVGSQEGRIEWVVVGAHQFGGVSWEI